MSKDISDYYKQEYQPNTQGYMDGVVIEIKPTRNAVVVEFHESGQKIVHLECVDESKQKELEEYAFRLLRS